MSSTFRFLLEDQQTAKLLSKIRTKIIKGTFRSDIAQQPLSESTCNRSQFTIMVNEALERKMSFIPRMFYNMAENTICIRFPSGASILPSLTEAIASRIAEEVDVEIYIDLNGCSIDCSEPLTSTLRTRLIGILEAEDNINTVRGLLVEINGILL